MPTASVLRGYLEGGLQSDAGPAHGWGAPEGNLEAGLAQHGGGHGGQHGGRQGAAGDIGQVERWPVSGNRRYAAGLAEMHRGSITAERRQITPVNGRALEILGHAIEYLADEYALSSLQLGTLDSGDPRVEAVQILILLNREVYFSNPEYEPLRRRLARWLFRSPALPAQSAAPLDRRL